MGLKNEIMTKEAKELIFINQIKRDGSGVLRCSEFDPTSEEYTLNRLSISEDTWIASGFNSYVVKLRK